MLCCRTTAANSWSFFLELVFVSVLQDVTVFFVSFCGGFDVPHFSVAGCRVLSRRFGAFNVSEVETVCCFPAITTNAKHQVTSSVACASGQEETYNAAVDYLPGFWIPPPTFSYVTTPRAWRAACCTTAVVKAVGLDFCRHHHRHRVDFRRQGFV